MANKVFGAIGDSITNGQWDEEGLGWFGRLTQKLVKRFPAECTFHNMSKGGDTTCDLYHRFAYEVFSRKCNVIIISIGINDLIREPNPNSPTRMSPSFRDKYWNLLLESAEKSKAKILITDILPIIEGKKNTGDRYNYNLDVREYNEYIEKMCFDKKIPFIKRFENWVDRDLSELYHDTVHPNAIGHQIICDEIYDKLIEIGYI